MNRSMTFLVLFLALAIPASVLCSYACATSSQISSSGEHDSCPEEQGESKKDTGCCEVSEIASANLGKNHSYNISPDLLSFDLPSQSSVSTQVSDQDIGFSYFRSFSILKRPRYLINSSFLI